MAMINEECDDDWDELTSAIFEGRTAVDIEEVSDPDMPYRNEDALYHGRDPDEDETCSSTGSGIGVPSVIFYSRGHGYDLGSPLESWDRPQGYCHDEHPTRG